MKNKLIAILTLGLIRAKKVEEESLNDIVGVFHTIQAKLKALQERHQAKIAEHNQEIAARQAAVSSLQDEHNTAVAIHSNIANNVLKTN